MIPASSTARAPGPGPRPATASPGRSQGLVARVLGLTLGAMVAVHSLAGLEIPHGPPPLPLAVSVSVIRSGEVGAVGGGSLLVGAPVAPGDGGTAHGRLLLASETAVPVDMSIRDVGSPTGLEDHVWLRVMVGEAMVFEGAQERLRRSSSRSLRISPGASVPIDVTVGLRPGAEGHAAGRRTEIRLQLATPVTGGRAGGSG